MVWCDRGVCRLRGCRAHSCLGGNGHACVYVFVLRMAGPTVLLLVVGCPCSCRHTYPAGLKVSCSVCPAAAAVLFSAPPHHPSLQIVEGRLDKIKKQYALLEQPALRDNNKTVGELIKETIAATGENIQVSGDLLPKPFPPPKIQRKPCRLSAACGGGSSMWWSMTMRVPLHGVLGMQSDALAAG